MLILNNQSLGLMSQILLKLDPYCKSHGSLISFHISIVRHSGNSLNITVLTRIKNFCAVLFGVTQRLIWVKQIFAVYRHFDLKVILLASKL